MLIKATTINKNATEDCREILITKESKVYQDTTCNNPVYVEIGKRDRRLIWIPPLSKASSLGKDSRCSVKFQNALKGIIVFAICSSVLLLLITAFTSYFRQSKGSHLAFYATDKLFSFNENKKKIPSTWTTSYKLPDNINLREVSSLDEMFKTNLCPSENVALVINLESTILDTLEWMQLCGEKIINFRINGNVEIRDLDQILNFLPNAQYIPIMAKYTAATAEGDMFDEKRIVQKIRDEGDVVTALEMKGYVSNRMSQQISELVPYVEDIHIGNAESSEETCKTLVRHPGSSKKENVVSWPWLTSLHLSLGSRCWRTYGLIFNSWDMPFLKSLKVTNSYIDALNVKYIEGIIDKYRITSVSFVGNTCDDVLKNSGRYSYICSNKRQL